jgi:hypothetical protein
MIFGWVTVTVTVASGSLRLASCAEMKAGEWLYLCIAHGNEEVCFVHITTSTIDLTSRFSLGCAIDYILHTVDSATVLLNSPRRFPSRYDATPHLQSLHTT